MAEYIEREALMKNFCGYDLTKCEKYGNKDADHRHDSYSTMMMYEIADEIIDATAADVSPVVHGRWVEKQGGFWETATCSNCGEKYPTVGIIPHYCPNCGARMDLEVMDNGQK